MEIAFLPPAPLPFSPLLTTAFSSPRKRGRVSFFPPSINFCGSGANDPFFAGRGEPPSGSRSDSPSCPYNKTGPFAQIGKVQPPPSLLDTITFSFSSSAFLFDGLLASPSPPSFLASLRGSGRPRLYMVLRRFSLFDGNSVLSVVPLLPHGR